MLCRNVQDAAHRASFGIAGTDRVGTIRHRDLAVGAQIHDYFGVVHKAVYMARRVVLRIRDKQHAGKANRCHVSP